MISPSVFLYFFLKCNIVNVKIILFFVGPLQQFFLINICHSSLSENGKKKFWGVPHFLHMCVIFWWIWSILSMFTLSEKKRIIWNKARSYPGKLLLFQGLLGYEYIWVWYLIKRKQVYLLCLKLPLFPNFFVIATSITSNITFLMPLNFMLNQQQWASW